MFLSNKLSSVEVTVFIPNLFWWVPVSKECNVVLRAGKDTLVESVWKKLKYFKKFVTYDF